MNIFRLTFLDVARKTTLQTRDGRQNPDQNIFINWQDLQNSLRTHVTEVGKVLWLQNELHIGIKMNGKMDWLTAMIELSSYYSIQVDTPNVLDNGVESYFDNMNERLWCVDILLDIGISFKDILETYKTFLSGHGGQHDIQEAMSQYQTWFQVLANVHSVTGGYTMEYHVKLCFKHFVDRVMSVLQQANSLENHADVTEVFLYQIETLIDTHLDELSHETSGIGSYMKGWILQRKAEIFNITKQLQQRNNSSLTRNMGF